MIADSLMHEANVTVNKPAESSQARLVREFSSHERDDWDDFVRSAPNSHPMQSWSWGEYKRRLGFIPVRLAVLQNGQMIAAAQMLIRKAFGIAIAYVPRGPVCPADDEQSYAILVDALHQHARQHRSLFLRIEPNERPGSSVGDVLRGHGFLASPLETFPAQPRVSLIVDLTGGPDAVMARMKKRTRNYVRSMSRRLDVRHASGEADLQLFHSLIEEVADRRKFDTRPLSYYRDLLEELGPRGEATLLLVEHEGDVIAGQLVVAHGQEGIALYNGRSSRHRNIPANQLLDWKSMEWCMERGCSRYDLYGVFELQEFHQRTDPFEPLTEDHIQPEMRGLFQYKTGFGPEHVFYIGPYDYPYNPILYGLWWRTAKWQLQGSNRLQTLRNRVDILRRNVQGARRRG